LLRSVEILLRLVDNFGMFCEYCRKV
jgi:hypothetical protein